MDFALLLFIFLLSTGLIWAIDRLWWMRQREQASLALQQAGESEERIAKVRREPVIVEYARAFFPVILLVFLLRSFLVEPFRIPSGSMMPGLLAGDFILVNKFTYGLRLPVANWKFLGLGSPQRGDVMVFRYPIEPSVNYIKRVVALPGDHLVYREKQLFINGQPMPQSPAGDYSYTESGDRLIFARMLTEQIDGNRHDILVTPGPAGRVLEFTVPAGHYFVMGDNRDNSNDSRFWGPVPERYVVGRAFLIWFSWDTVHGGVSWNRIGNSIH